MESLKGAENSENKGHGHHKYPCLHEKTATAVWRFLEEPDSSPAANWFAIVMLLLIIVSACLFVLESWPVMYPYTCFFDISEAVMVIIFTIEYILRVIFVPRSRTRFLFEFLSIVDAIALGPFYL